jgi:pimeloyl-ACP methyl ester carboxylesterase
VNGVRVPYLDWGGTGDALVFIPGMGNSAHVFDDFAPRFTDRFRVLGVTRVGFGESDQPERDGYDLASRVAHIRTTLDSLHISRAVLVGHSLGGDEITAFAGAHPERTAGLVYLDAAIDHTKALTWEQVLAEFSRVAPRPSVIDLASAEAYQQFLGRMLGVEFPIGEVLATTLFDSAGVVVGSRAAERVFLAIVAATVSPDFTLVQAPVLSLYSDSATAADVLAWLRNDAAQNARATAAIAARVRPEMEAERARFARDVKGAQIFAYRAHHYQFLSVPDDTERRMREFFSSLGGP